MGFYNNKDKRKFDNREDGRDIFSSSKYLKKPNFIIQRVKHLRDSLTVDFEKPLTFSDQMIIMFVVLFVSCILFGSLFLISECAPHTKMENIAQADASSVSGGEKAAPSKASEKEVSAQSEVGTAPESSVNSETSRNEDSSEPSKTSETNQESSELLFSVTIKDIVNDEMHSGALILVNKECMCYQNGENIAPIVGTGTIYYDVTSLDVGFDSKYEKYFNKMLEDFYHTYGDTEIMVACGYRSYEVQARLFNEEKENKGEETAEQWVAPPGFSEHQTGLAVDLNLNIDSGSGGIKYSGEDIYSWINSNCYKYGFIVRYPKGKEIITGYEYEPWHFRYVGEPAATYIHEKNITLEEYIEILHTHSVDKPLKITGDDGKIWYTYYCRASDGLATEVPVPDKLYSTVSGDNYSGYIVTVYMEEPEDKPEEETENEVSSQTEEEYYY